MPTHSITMSYPILAFSNKLYKIYSWPGLVSSPMLYIGRNRLGNDAIINITQTPDMVDNCTWFHLKDKTSAHAILYSTTALSLQETNIIVAYLRKQVFQKAPNEVICCPLKYVVKTSSPGLVTYSGEILL